MLHLREACSRVCTRNRQLQQSSRHNAGPYNDGNNVSVEHASIFMIEASSIKYVNNIFKAALG
jgi:hypothetical protein